MMAPYSGKFGVGCKHIWSQKRQNFMFVFYPVERQAFDNAMKSDINKMPFDQYGERGRLGFGEANMKMMGSGAVKFF